MNKNLHSYGCLERYITYMKEGKAKENFQKNYNELARYYEKHIVEEPCKKNPFVFFSWVRINNARN